MRALGTRLMLLMALGVGLSLSTACDDDDDADADGDIDGDADGDGDGDGDSDADGDGDADSDSDVDGDGDSDGETQELQILLPAEGAEALFSVATRVEPPGGTARVEVSVATASELRCESRADAFECLLPVHELSPGPFEIMAVAFNEGDAELATVRRTMTKREVPDPCEGFPADDVVACVNERATAGLSAGFAGLTYLNCDDRHANVNTSAMEGIDARVRVDVPWSPLDDVTVGIGNESRACNDSGWSSIPRCRYPIGLSLFEANFLMFWPEHRDHGYRDFYQWQAQHFELSQGSSGSERDEVIKSLAALGVMSGAARDGLVAVGRAASAVQMLLRRSRVVGDRAYLEPETHVTAIDNMDNGGEMLRLAAAMVDGELPVPTRVAVTSAVFPDGWSFSGVPALETPFAVGYAPSVTPETPPDGQFTIEVSLEETGLESDGELVFFWSVIRGDAEDVTVERLDAAGTQWRISGSHPGDVTLMTGGFERIVSRATVGFFAHNGLWLGPPAFVSVGGREASTFAPNDNNLD